MYKVAILGCENSHANSFLNHVNDTDYKNEIEFVGVYSNEEEPAKKLSEEFGVYAAKSYDEFVGKVDAIIITARHGDNHYKYAKPYIKTGIPMFIDKPITCTEEDAKAFQKELEENNIKIFGGSMCVFADLIQELKKAVEENKYGKAIGGYLRAPLLGDSPYGGFYFYAQHLVQVMTEIYGCYPKSVVATEKNKNITCIVRYEDFDVNLSYVNDNFNYYAGVSFEEKFVGDNYIVDDCFPAEFENFYNLISKGKQRLSYDDFFAPVYILNAIDRALKSGKEEKINYEG